MSFLLKKFSDFLGISDPEYVRAPPLDGEIIYCKNNVCVHPPSNLAKTAEHYPGYLTLRSQGNGHKVSSLILTWIPNSSLDKPRRRSPRSSSETSPVKDTGGKTNVQEHLGQEADGMDASAEQLPVDAGSTNHNDDSWKEVPNTSSQANQDSRFEIDAGRSLEADQSTVEQNGIVSGDSCDNKEDYTPLKTVDKQDDDKGVDETNNTDPQSSVSQKQDGTRRASNHSGSSESDSISTDAQLALLLGDKTSHKELERPRDLMVGPSNMQNNSNNKAKDESLSSASSNPSSLPSPLRSLMRDQMIRDMQDLDSEDCGASVSSSTTPTTSNPDPGSLPSSPGNEPFDPFMPLYNQNTPPSLISPASPLVTHNLTFPDNSIEYISLGSKSPHMTPKEQLCGVFSVDLSQMRSLRVFFSSENSTSGQLVIASQESQYKILHFHHGGLERLTEVFEHWRCCIKQRSKSKLARDSNHLYHKFTILQSRMKPSDCHPEEGVYDEVSEEMWWSYLNERGQVEDNYELRKAIFFGGIDEYLRREIWPFLLHYFAFDSTLEERNAQRGEKREEYEAIKRKRLTLSEEDQEVFWRNVQCTVDKDVVRTDRSHPYFKGDNNPNIDIMRDVLLNFAIYKPAMGYTQGMSDLLAPVLAELQDEADAFWCFVGLMDNIIFVSSPKDEDMEKQLGYLKALMKLMLPDFWSHLLTLNDAMDLLFCHRLSTVINRALLDVCRGKKQAVASLSNHYQRCYSSRSNILTLSERGIFKDIFPEANSDLPKVLTSEPQCLYCGFDPTVSSLHIGNLLAIIALIHCQRAGHKPIALIGGATALVGDPSGKTKEREPLQSAEVQSNAVSIKESLERIFTNHERYFWNESKPLPQIRIMDNHSWYKDINVISFLSGVGRKLRMGTLLSRQSVQTRLASSQGMNFAEFSYQLFQAYDFLHLHMEYGCLIQLGGTDQLGNLMTGHDLVKRVTGKDVYGIAIPLVTSSTGNKLGKTAGNAVWVNEDKTSPFDLYQYFVRLPDADMERYLKLFTFLPLNEIDDVVTKHKKTPKNRKAQEKLAEQVLLLVHGESGLDKAIRQTDALYSTDPQSLEQLSETEITELFPGASITSLLLEPGYSVGQLLDRLKCLPQGYRGDKILQAGGVYINHRRVTRADQVLINGEHILDNNLTLVRIGKKNYHVVKWV